MTMLGSLTTRLFAAMAAATRPAGAATARAGQDQLARTFTDVVKLSGGAQAAAHASSKLAALEAETAARLRSTQQAVHAKFLAALEPVEVALRAAPSGKAYAAEELAGLALRLKPRLPLSVEERLSFLYVPELDRAQLLANLAREEASPRGAARAVDGMIAWSGAAYPAESRACVLAAVLGEVPGVAAGGDRAEAMALELARDGAMPLVDARVAARAFAPRG